MKKFVNQLLITFAVAVMAIIAITVTLAGINCYRSDSIIHGIEHAFKTGKTTYYYAIDNKGDRHLDQIVYQDAGGRVTTYVFE